MRPYSSSSGKGSFGRNDHILQGTTTDCVSRVKFSTKECPLPLLGVTAWDGTCSVWQVGVTNGLPTSTPMWQTNSGAPLLDLSFSNDGRAFFGGCSKTASMWNLQTNQTQVVASHDLPISCLSYVNNYGTEMLITGSWDGKLRWWDLRQQNPAKEENLGEPIFDMDAQRAPPMMSVATGRTVHLYNLQNMAKVGQVTPSSFVQFGIRRVSSSPQMDGVAIGSAEGRVSFIALDPQSKQSCTFKAHTSQDRGVLMFYQTNFCQFHPTKPIFVTGGGDGSLSVVDKNQKSQLFTHPCQVKQKNEPVSISAGDVSGDGTLVAYAHSYDWSLGRGGFKNQPTSVHLRTLETV